METESDIKPTKSKTKLVALYVCGGLIAIILVLIAAFFYQISLPKSKSDKQIIYEVKSGESIHQVAVDLKKAGTITSATAFEAYVKLGPARGKLMPGPYAVRSSMNIREISRLMSTGQIAVVKFTIPEGYTVNKIAKLWEANDMGSAEDFVAATKKSYQYPFLEGNNTKGNLEGYLFPATYEVKLNAKPQDLIEMMLDAFAKQAQPVVNSQSSTSLSPAEIITLASIVEYEGKTEDDRKLIAGVFLNRLAAGIKLQSDVTVNYATGKSLTSAADVKVNSPYNTYIAKGLPPAPIGSPGLESIKAVLSPTKSDYIFFLAGNDGKIYYAKTLSDHEKNIKTYLQ